MEKKVGKQQTGQDSFDITSTSSPTNGWLITGIHKRTIGQIRVLETSDFKSIPYMKGWSKCRAEFISVQIDDFLQRMPRLNIQPGLK